jgi:hypothetical protein
MVLFSALLRIQTTLGLLVDEFAVPTSASDFHAGICSILSYASLLVRGPGFQPLPRTHGHGRQMSSTRTGMACRRYRQEVLRTLRRGCTLHCVSLIDWCAASTPMGRRYSIPPFTGRPHLLCAKAMEKKCFWSRNHFDSQLRTCGDGGRLSWESFTFTNSTL